MIDITIRVPNEKWAEVFWGWYLDGGGDDAFSESLADQGIAEPGMGDQVEDKDKWMITHTE